MNQSTSQKHRERLLERKRELEEQLKPLRELEAELHEVDRRLSTYETAYRAPSWGGPGPDDR